MGRARGDKAIVELVQQFDVHATRFRTGRAGCWQSPLPASSRADEDLILMRQIDEIYLQWSFYGAGFATNLLGEAS